MAVIIKKIGKNEYAYLAIREGKKVVHKYLGSVNDPQVERIVSGKTELSRIPERFRSLFWDTTLENINIKKHARYIIERVLEFGDLNAIKWLQRVYPVKVITDFMNISRGITERSKSFWMIWFGVNDA